MMVLYSGITCPFSQRCRFVLFEKGMDFEIVDVDIFNKPEDLAVMNPYNQVPVLVERDLILYESNIINEYIDERFPHPQLMPGRAEIIERMRPYIAAHLESGGELRHVGRHLLGLYQGEPGARGFRRTLSEARPGAGLQVLDRAIEWVERPAT